MALETAPVCPFASSPGLHQVGLRAVRFLPGASRAWPTQGTTEAAARGPRPPPGSRSPWWVVTHTLRLQPVHLPPEPGGPSGAGPDDRGYPLATGGAVSSKYYLKQTSSQEKKGLSSIQFSCRMG